MLRKLRDFCFTTKPKKLSDLVCDGRRWMNHKGDAL